jgi:SanA protein
VKVLFSNLLFLIIAFLVSGWLISTYMEVRATPVTYSDPSAIPGDAEAVIVPGASVYRSGRLSPVLQERMEAALEATFERPGILLVLSGTTVPDGYSETRAMRDYALARGFPAEDLRIDDDGRSTFLTLLNARQRFGLDNVIIVSQSYHLPRSLYIARRLGLEAHGLRAEVSPETDVAVRNTREWLSRTKDFALVRVFHYFLSTE